MNFLIEKSAACVLGRLRLLSVIAAFIALFVGTLWCVGAFYYAFDLAPGTATAAAAALTLLYLSCFFVRRAVPALVFVILTTAAAYFRITPEKRLRDIRWQRSWERVADPRRQPDGSILLRDVRDFRYRTEKDFDVRYTELRLLPDDISSIDVAFSHWDDLEVIAHTMIGLNFRGGKTVVISLETRLPDKMDQNALDGFYRHYALAMLAGTPRDLYGLRTDHRGETLYVYRLDLNNDNIRTIASSLLNRAEKLHRKQEFYNSLVTNCTTGLLPMLPGARGLFFGDIRLITNGFGDKMLFEKELLVRRPGESFASLRARCVVPGISAGAGAPKTRYRGTSEARYLVEKETPSVSDGGSARR